MSRLFSGIPVFMLALLVFTSFTSDTVAAEDKWWEHHDEGWHFYQDPEPEPDYDGQPSPSSTMSSPDNKPEPLATDLIKKKGERLLSEAMMNPTEENVESYMKFQKESMERSQTFAYIWQRLLMKEPELYMDTGTQKVNQDIQNALAKLGTQAGLFFVYSSGCDACRQSAAVVSEFRQKYDGFVVLPVTIDAPLPELEGTRPDNGISGRLGVNSVPAWYLAYPGEDRFEHIGTGYMPLSEVERRLYHYALTNNTGVSAYNYYGN